MKRFLVLAVAATGLVLPAAANAGAFQGVVIAKNAKRRNGMQAVFRARQFIHPVTREELDGIVELWVDAALRLGERDLRMMHRLVRAQMRRMESRHGAPLEVAAALHEPLAVAG